MNRLSSLASVSLSSTAIVTGLPASRAATRTWRESGELVYTGLRRTPVSAVLGMDVARAPFSCQRSNFAKIVSGIDGHYY